MIELHIALVLCFRIFYYLKLFNVDFRYFRGRFVEEEENIKGLVKRWDDLIIVP